MSEMPAAARAEDFRANHAERAIMKFDDVFLGKGLKEAGPAGATVELGMG